MIHNRYSLVNSIAILLFVLLGQHAFAQQDNGAQEVTAGATENTKQILDPQQQTMVDDAINRALMWLAANQQPDGSFPTLPQGQPGVTSLGAMAFLSAGHTLEGGPYADKLH